MLGTFFESVFIEEGEEELPEFADRCPKDQAISHHTFNEEDVRLKLRGLKPDKSQGSDDIHPMVLIECADVLCGPLYKIYAKSLDEGELPHDWKTALVTPLHKKGSRTKPENYRPVSLTSIPCKVLESLLRDQLLEHVKVHNLASKHQHGFTSGQSCFTNLLEAIEDWTRAYDEGLDVDIMYLDYRKAFDTVPHKRLIKKLKAYGISGTLIGWIESFLMKRQMRVRINGKCQGGLTC